MKALGAILVQVEPADVVPNAADAKPERGAKATCTECGRCAEGLAADGLTGHVARFKSAVAAALEDLHEQCERRTPWDCVPLHVDRRVAAGVMLYIVDRGNLIPVYVDEKNKLYTVWCGVGYEVPVLVRPNSDSQERFAAALEVRDWLIRKGYRKAQIVKAESKAKVSA